ncbi:unnamed protein product [Camellia sinensis]
MNTGVPENTVLPTCSANLAQPRSAIFNPQHLPQEQPSFRFRPRSQRVDPTPHLSHNTDVGLGLSLSLSSDTEPTPAMVVDPSFSDSSSTALNISQPMHPPDMIHTPTIGTAATSLIPGTALNRLPDRTRSSAAAQRQPFLRWRIPFLTNLISPTPFF